MSKAYSCMPDFFQRLIANTSALLSVLFFVGGFVWDATTIGKQVVVSDIVIFAGYLLLAAVLMYQLAQPSMLVRTIGTYVLRWPWLQARVTNWPVADWPYWVLQFLFGSLLSALFILYFKSAGSGLAWAITVVLGVLVVANEFLESRYRRLTLCWSMFGLCAILWCNFAFPFLFGSVHAFWFYLSTLVGAGSTFVLYQRAPHHAGRIWPVGLIAGLLMLAYRADMIPPVPLVKQAIVVAYAVEKTPEGYWMTVEKAPWWQFWRVDATHLHILPDEKLVCFSAVFAPQGLHTRLRHDWQKREGGRWVSVSTPSFALSGGRAGGYRGYTYKTQPSAGEWRVRIQTETNQTVAERTFRLSVLTDISAYPRVRVRY